MVVSEQSTGVAGLFARLCKVQREQFVSLDKLIQGSEKQAEMSLMFGILWKESNHSIVDKIDNYFINFMEPLISGQWA